MLRILPLLLIGLLPAALRAQVNPQQAPRADSMRTQTLQEIVVQSGGHLDERAVTLQRVRLAGIEQTEAPSVAEAARLIPAAHVQTNSRGETLVYLRDAGERQIAFFFDGALLNVPWDNRVDLSLIPTSVIGGLSVAKGVPPVEYGANTLGGAVNFTSRSVEAPGGLTEITGVLGTQQSLHGAAAHHGRAGRFSYSGAVGYARRDGIQVSDEADLPFSQEGSLRTNTDAQMANLFGRIAYDFTADTRIGLSVLHVDAEKGVAPEGHLDPAVESVRFWRYPDWRTTMIIASGSGRLGARANWKAAAWTSTFTQTIDAYADGRYDRLESQQQDDDRTAGARFTLHQEMGRGAVTIALNALTSTHEQRDLTLENGAPVQEASFPLFTYRQHLFSAGASYDVRPLRPLLVTVGGSYDAMLMPETGDKPGRDPFTDYSLNVGTRLDVAAGWFVRASAGRKTRFPTMRELFGEALQRFLVNPGLKPESAFLVEAGAGVEGAHFSGEIIPFGTFTHNTIDQRNVTVDGVRRRQRINLKGSRVLGVEMVGAVRPVSHVEVAGHLTLMNVRRLPDAPDDPSRLSEKPEVLARLAGRYAGPQGLSALVEVLHTGRAYSLNVDDVFVPLNRSVAFNVRLGYRLDLPIQRSAAAELFLRADNLTDTLVMPQLGLPDAGRTLRAGIDITL